MVNNVWWMVWGARVQVEARLRQLEGKILSSASGAGKGKSTGQPSPYDKDRKGGGALLQAAQVRGREEAAGWVGLKA